jgi:hypothetical protein
MANSQPRTEQTPGHDVAEFRRYNELRLDYKSRRQGDIEFQMTMSQRIERMTNNQTE